MDNINTPNNLPAQKTPGKGKYYWLFVVGVLILLIIVALAYKLMTNNPKEPYININGNNSAERVTNQNDGFPDTFYSYIGTITAIDGKEITIEAKANVNFLTKDTQIKILTDEQTNFVKLIIPNKIDSDQLDKANQIFNQLGSSFDELKVGDKINAISYNNIKGKTEFTADQIELSEVK